MAVGKKQIRFDSNEERFQRFDVAPLRGRPTRTAQGFLRVPANLTRTGILKYKRQDGSTVSELRHPDDVFNEDSIRSLAGAVLTDRHQAMINPENVSEHQIGYVESNIDHDGTFGRGVVMVQRKDALNKILKKRAMDLSPGYSCRIDPTPGEWNGQRYDQRQTSIEYNHVALIPRGEGRQGSEIAIKLDSKSAISIDPESLELDGPEELEMKKITIRLDGIDYTIEVPEALAATLEGALAKLQTERTDSTASLAELQGRFDALTKELADVKAELVTAESAERLDSRVSARVELVEKATKLNPKLETKGKSDMEIKIEALEAKGFKRETFDSKEAAYVDGVFEATCNQAPAAPAKPAVPGILPKGKEKREDSKEDRTPEQARAAMIERAAQASKNE